MTFYFDSLLFAKQLSKKKTTQLREMQGNSHFFKILFWCDQWTEEKNAFVLCVFKTFRRFMHSIHNVSTFSFSSLTLFPHKKEASTTLFSSVLTISFGRDAKLHHHNRWDRAIQLHVFKSTITLEKKKEEKKEGRLYKSFQTNMLELCSSLAFS